MERSPWRHLQVREELKRRWLELPLLHLDDEVRLVPVLREVQIDPLCRVVAVYERCRTLALGVLSVMVARDEGDREHVEVGITHDELREGDINRLR